MPRTKNTNGHISKVGICAAIYCTVYKLIKKKKNTHTHKTKLNNLNRIQFDGLDL
jgi:hypothetical protein